jgi:hypothetical protein
MKAALLCPGRRRDGVLRLAVIAGAQLRRFLIVAGIRHPQRLQLSSHVRLRRPGTESSRDSLLEGTGFELPVREHGRRARRPAPHPRGPASSHRRRDRARCSWPRSSRAISRKSIARSIGQRNRSEAGRPEAPLSLTGYPTCGKSAPSRRSRWPKTQKPWGVSDRGMR